MSRKHLYPALTRRELLHLLTLLGGSTAMALFQEGCSTSNSTQLPFLTPTAGPDTAMTSLPNKMATSSIPTQSMPTQTDEIPSITPTTASEEHRAKIAFVKTHHRADGVRQAVSLLGINPAAGKKVFLKPNFNSSDAAPGSTHPDVLMTLVTLLKEMGATNITVGDRSGMGNTRTVMEKAGVFQLSKKMGFDVLALDDLKAADWVMIEPPGSHWAGGFPFARPPLEADALVQTCCLKTHRYGGQFTLSLKNAVGMVAKRVPQANHDFMQELHGSPDQRKMIAEINTAYTPALIVIDGVEALISGGPDIGERVTPDVILAGTDRIAMDAVGVALLRHFGCKTEVARGKIFEQDQIARAVELGLGIRRPDQIEFITGDPDSAAYSQVIQEVLRNG